MSAAGRGDHGYDAGRPGPQRPWRDTGQPSYPGTDPQDYGLAYGRLTAALSGFLDDLAEALPDPALVAELTAQLEGWSGKLQPLAVPEAERPFGRRTDLDGRGQSMSPTIVVTGVEPDRVTGTVRFGPYYLGGNGAAHGGTVPLMFDEVLGRLANAGGRPPSRTAYLHTDFRSITPIGPKLDLRAWVVSEEGRKRVLRATLHHRDVLCAEAEGLFVALRPGQP